MQQSKEKEGLRHRIHQKLHRFRDKCEDTLHEKGVHPPQQANASITTNSSSSHQTSHRNHEAQIQSSDMSLNRDSFDQDLTTKCRDTISPSPDIWSAAFQEAVEGLDAEIEVIALKGKNIIQLFRDLEDIEKGETQDSVFLKGVRCLQSLRVPLETFKLALDLASPLSTLDPTAGTVVGVVRSVTAIAISFATADLDFAKRIGEMLRQISYIDDCDTLGQKSKRRDIHEALVSAYQKILEFYEAALDILSRKGTRMIVKTVLDNDRLPNIVKDFLSCSDLLQKLILNATNEISAEILDMCYDREINTWLGREEMSQQTLLHTNLKVHRAHQTCGFLLKTESFTEWYYSSESQQLAIFGDMGCGKSVAMAYLLDNLRQRNDQLPRPKICCYYCRDDGTAKDIRIFSALILSLLDQLPGLKKQFVADYKQAQSAGIYDPAVDPKILEELLQGLLKGIDRPIFFIIDGLDECDRPSRNNLLKILKSLSETFSRFKCIISSRPNEEILDQLSGILQVELGPDTERDFLIVESVVEEKLSHLPAKVKALIVEELSPRAGGSAIWTRMTIELIQALNTTALGPMQLFLEELPLPTELSNLYNTLISRCASNIAENEHLARVALQLLTVSRRPLSILELTWAVTLNGTRNIKGVRELAQRVDCQRLMSLIYPFVTRVDFNDVKRQQVRLVHQSVKEFVLKECASNRGLLAGPAPMQSDNAPLDQCSQGLEALMFRICTRYLLLDDIDDRDLFSNDQLALAELPQEIDLFNDNEEPIEYDPHCTWDSWEEDMIRFDPTERGFGEFFVYASSHWLDHFSSITVEALPLLAGVEDICRAGSTRLHNWTQQNCRPGCTIMPRFQFDSRLYDPLAITSLYGSEPTFLKMLEDSNFENGKFLSEPAIAAADQILQWGDVSRLRTIFFNEKLGHQLQNPEFFRLIIRRWYEPSKRWTKRGVNRHNWEVLFDLIDHMSERMVQEKWGKDLLCSATSASCMPIVQRLINRSHSSAELRSELLRVPDDNFKNTALYVAIQANHLAVIEFLVEAGADLGMSDQSGNTPLHLASEVGSAAVAKILLGASDREAKNHAGKTALQIATDRGNRDVVRALQI